MNIKYKKFAILGAGNIGLIYSKLLKKKGIHISYASSSSVNSNKWKIFKKNNPNVQFRNNKEILLDDTVDIILSCLPHLEQIKIFPTLLASKKKIFIEKPFQTSSNKFKKLIQKYKKNLNNKYISFNRRYYEPVQFLKSKLQKKKPKLARITISENLNKTKYKNFNFLKFFPYYGSSSHILDLLFYLFGSIKIKNIFYHPNKKHIYSSSSFLLSKNCPIYLFIDEKAAMKNSIEVVFEDNEIFELYPIEKLNIYQDYTIKYNKKNLTKSYMPKEIFSINEKSKYFPSLEKTLNNFIKNDNFKNDYKLHLKYISFIEKIFKIKN